MPHSNRKKRNATPAQKRFQVTDDDGWTHVTSGSNVRRVVRTTTRNDREQYIRTDEEEPVLSPAEAPARLTFGDLEAQYRGYKEKWVQSETWQRLKGQLDQRIRDQEAETNEGSRDIDVNAMPIGFIDQIVCIGLGSPSGFLRDGWVDRRAVSMYQLAALDTIRNTLTNSNRSLPLSFPVYAQDPVFNALDRALLESLGMTVVESPVAFERVTSKTLLFCPGAERKHLDILLPSNPQLVLGGPLEDTESSIIQTYAEKTESRVLVPFSAQEHAFWKMRLYIMPQFEGGS
ncbi:uncharacterized protein N7469_002589 [Penicillium citrinum]|uniref:SRR1-like domain-containing protein n=1 Tax=Penicillium citrinum TaxID=5077 RepID=A0A9W9TUD5_PENCI|nr:uncharacterized protein N7469_002589 [Penicillium citrinum]KAJ5240998.1 hypothetical protein N7469_002589 [Penicillium citrinum]